MGDRGCGIAEKALTDTLDSAARQGIWARSKALIFLTAILAAVVNL
jgi:hypothetical protein